MEINEIASLNNTKKNNIPEQYVFRSFCRKCSDLLRYDSRAVSPSKKLFSKFKPLCNTTEEDSID